MEVELAGVEGPNISAKSSAGDLATLTEESGWSSKSIKEVSCVLDDLSYS